MCLDSRLWTLLLVGSLACGSPKGELEVAVDEQGTVTISLVNEEMPVSSDAIYLLVRSENAQLIYAGAAAAPSLCEQLPREGPLVLRLTEATACPEVHVAAFHFQPPKPAEGEMEVVVPLEQRCVEHRSLIATASWFEPDCMPEAGVLDGGDDAGEPADALTDAGTSTTTDASSPDASNPDAAGPDAGNADAGAMDVGTSSSADASTMDSGMDAGTSSTSDGGMTDGAG